MQLTSTTGTMVVDYFPIEGSTQFLYKVLKFQGVDTMSTKCITKRDFENECAERIGMMDIQRVVLSYWQSPTTMMIYFKS